VYSVYAVKAPSPFEEEFLRLISLNTLGFFGIKKEDLIHERSGNGAEHRGVGSGFNPVVGSGV
jgi:hypothetical protein